MGAEWDAGLFLAVVGEGDGVWAWVPELEYKVFE